MTFFQSSAEQSVVENNFYNRLLELLQKKYVIKPDYIESHNKELNKKILSFTTEIDSRQKNNKQFLTLLASRIDTYQQNLHNEPDAQKQYELFLNTLITIFKNKGFQPHQDIKNHYHAQYLTPVGISSNISYGTSNSKAKIALGLAGIIGIAGISAFFYISLIGTILTPLAAAIAIVGLAFLCIQNSNDNADEIRDFENELFDRAKELCLRGEAIFVKKEEESELENLIYGR